MLNPDTQYSEQLLRKANRSEQKRARDEKLNEHTQLFS